MNRLIKLVGIIISILLFVPVSGKASAQVITSGTQCSRPGPVSDSTCTVMYRIDNSSSSQIICVWVKETNGLFECQAKSLWGDGFNGVTSPGVTLEFRRHTTWPTTDPNWPSNPAAVRASGTLLKSQYVTSRYRTSPTAACSVTVALGQNIQTAINSAGNNATVCLSAGVYGISSTIRPKTGQTLRSASATNQAILRASTTQSVVSIENPNITLKNLQIEGTATVKPDFGVVVLGASATNALVEKVKITYAHIGFGVSNSASNVELRSSDILYAGDGVACTGCADPSIWINASSDVRIVQSTLMNNGASPEGDGELACYNTSGLVVTNTVVQDSGAAGMYLVNCDYAVVSGNDIYSAGEWGLDIVDTGQPSGSDYGLFSLNHIEGSRHGAGVIEDSKYAVFIQNEYVNNRQGPNASGSCNGINRRGSTTGYYYMNDYADPWPVVCND